MVKHISLVHRNPDMSRHEFRHYWVNVHAELVKTRLPGLRRYVAGLALDDPAPGSGVNMSCDAVVELHFDDLEALQAAMASPAWLSSERRASSERLIDLTRHQVMVAEEYVVPLGAPPSGAAQ